MLSIERVSNLHFKARVCASFGIEDKNAFAYAAYSKDKVLASAVFCPAEDGCVCICGADTGRHLDVGLIDGIIRAALIAQLRAGAKTARLGGGISDEVRLALTKLGYPGTSAFDLNQFFAKKDCAKQM